MLVSFALNFWFIKIGIKLKEKIEVGGMVMERMTGEISLFTLLFPAILVILFSVLASLFPAYKASKIQPQEAMRHYS